MKAIVCGFSFAILAVTARGEFVRADLSSAADKDIVFESTAAPSEVFGEHPEARQLFAMDGYDDGHCTAVGLPPNRVVESTMPGMGTYVFLPYAGKNAIELASSGGAPAESHLVDLPNKAYEKIGMVVASVEGDTAFSIIMNYEDGTSTTNVWEADDWADAGNDVRPSQHPLISGMDRVSVDGVIENAKHYSVFEVVVTADDSRVLDTIVVGNVPYRAPAEQKRWAAIFAINACTKAAEEQKKAR